jgi:hypothetical protein
MRGASPLAVNHAMEVVRILGISGVHGAFLMESV